ncbi:hypothetical protein PG993_001822 [Apiospora rasikravindrae]|uniref:RNase MRP protein 1 RNA binding domain-containing protein n=1 Tax=Apiospora rasikravindrae TaxID=990691 RepID=A0ABR1UCJ7_9PEZI
MSKTQPTAESNVYNDTLLLIRPVQPLLAGFHHRNKNQHRVATWWASFNMLRRHVTKWTDELDQQAKARPKKRKRTAAAAAAAKNQGGDSSGPAEVRALWLRDILMPKCYLSFSQLASDNQFAPLGLVLTGALAQLYNACVRFVGEAPTETDEIVVRLKAAAAVPEATSTSLSAATTVREKKATKDTTTTTPSSAAVPIRQAHTKIDDDDVGQVISRDSVRAVRVGAGEVTIKEERAEKVKRRKKASVFPVEEEEDLGDDVMAVSAEKKKRKGAATVQAKAKDGEKLPGEKEKKKKKKSKKGDEFDSLFSSLF